MLVSVIIPSYNRAGTIERAVNSVLAQTWKSLEVIVVDSESTDGTLKILAAYGDRIQVIRQKKEGPGAARNAGIKAAKGEIISFLDSDDEWLPHKTERQVKLLQATESLGVKCCVCNARMEFITGTIYSFAAARLHPKLNEGVWINPAEVLTTRFLFFNQVVAVRRDALEQAGYFRQGIMEDYDLALRLSLVGPWAFIADPLVVWHEQAGDNLSRTHSQLEISRRTLEILQDASDSSCWGPLLPETLLRRRVRVLKQGIGALRLSARTNPAIRFFGKLLLLYLRGCYALHRHSSSFPHMIARAI
ncbi:MAG TPA: glycosyltransferase [Verrucomicrobiae bacterium]|jgi:glycosyltransferase involved in cell wall biosynthesis|nr:glycosyltransferase [Verrucomicrobiae bacterium]